MRRINRTREYLKALLYAKSQMQSEVINFNGKLALLGTVATIDGEKFHSISEVEKRIALVKTHIKKICSVRSEVSLGKTIAPASKAKY